MAAEMVNRKMRFLWNAGKDTKVIEHSDQLETNKPPDPLPTKIESYPYNHYWYQVRIER